MCTARSLTDCISWYQAREGGVCGMHAPCHTCPPPHPCRTSHSHAWPLPCTPPSRARPSPHMSPSHAWPPLACMPPGHTCPPPLGTHPPGHACPPAHTHPSPPCGQNSWHTLLKIFPCPNPRLRAVMKKIERKGRGCASEICLCRSAIDC